MEARRRIRAYILWLLGRRDYSRKQLLQKLKAKALSGEEGLSLLDELEKEGLFSEERYVHSRSRQLLRRGLGTGFVKAKLRGESRAPTEIELNELFAELDSSPQEELHKLVEKALRRDVSLDFSNQNTREAFIKKFQRKGHARDAVLKALQSVGAL